MFFKNLYSRMMFKLKSEKLPRYADFTLGDFGGVDECYPNLNSDNKGTSLILVHNKKGNDLLKELKDIHIYKNVI